MGASEFDKGLKVLEEQRCAPDTNPELCWEGLLAQFSTLLPPSLSKLLAQHLATRHYSPRLEAFKNLLLQESLPEEAVHACAVTVVDGVFVSSAGDLQTELSNPSHINHKPPSTVQTPVDHVLHTAESESAPTVVLYGAPGTNSFHSARSAIQQALNASGQDFQYIIRPVATGECLSGQDGGIRTWLAAGTADPLQLAGYGVELFIKDTEYSQVRY